MQDESTAPRDRSLLKLGGAAALILLVFVAAPAVVDIYQMQLLTYGLIAAIAALGFNLLLGYTGLLSFGHSAYPTRSPWRSSISARIPWRSTS